jgi:DNA mismatch repair protein MutS
LFTASKAPAAALAQSDALGQALDAIDPDALSPRAALEALYALKKLRAGES